MSFEYYKDAKRLYLVDTQLIWSDKPLLLEFEVMSVSEKQLRVAKLSREGGYYGSRFSPVGAFRFGFRNTPKEAWAEAVECLGNALPGLKRQINNYLAASEYCSEELEKASRVADEGGER